jgi:AraC family transcriptional regulator of arabinose operon
MMNRRGVGFTGQHMIEVPKEIIKKCRTMPLIGNLFITKMGIYPKALYHYFQRPKGMAEVLLIYCTDGEGWIKMPDTRIRIKTGDLYVIPPGVPHSYGSDDENPWTIYWLHLGGHSVDETMEALMGDTPLIDRALPAGVFSERLLIFERIEKCFSKGYSVNNLMFANLTLPYFLASFILPENFHRVNLASGPASYAERAIEFMQAHITEPVNLAGISQSVHLSVSFFSRAFKKETGYAPVEYFNYLKIQRACQLLHNSNLRVNEVALQIGIDDPFYFSRF